MNVIQIHDQLFQPLIEHDRIMAAIDEMAISLNHELRDKEVVFLAILNGSFIFAADLLRQIHIDCRISFLKISSYEGTTIADMKILVGLNEVIKSKTVVILEDIIDTGNTLDTILNLVAKEKPAEIKVATLLLKPDAYEYPHQINYVGFRIPNQFVVGYGLDYNGFGRNLNSIYTLT